MVGVILGILFGVGGLVPWFLEQRGITVPSWMIIWGGWLVIGGFSYCLYYPLLSFASKKMQSKSQSSGVICVLTLSLVLVGVIAGAAGTWWTMYQPEGLLQDDRTQIRKWLQIGKITITDETTFQFFILDADKNTIQIFASQQAAPFVTFGSILQISDRTSIKTFNSFSYQKRQLIMNELKSELLKLNLDIDSEANVNWELKLSRHVVFDKNLTQQQFLNEILTINQGLALAKSILDKYLA